MFQCVASRAAKKQATYQLFKRLLNSSSASSNSSTPQSSLSHADQISAEFDKYRSYTPEEGFVWKSRYEKIAVPDLTVDQYVWKNVSKWQNKVAIVCGITGRKYTYAKLRDHCAAVAVRLQTEYNLKKGDVVGICLNNIPEYAIALLGAIEAGLIVTTINPNYTPDEISHQLILSKPKLLFGLAENFQNLATSREMAGLPLEIISVRTSKTQPLPNGSGDLYQLMQPKNVDFSILNGQIKNPADVCVLPYSSGTTGLPKGVILSHSNLTSNCEVLDAKMPEKRLTLPTTNDFQDVLPSVLPFFHIYGLNVSLISKLSLGCKIVTLPKFEPESFLTTLAEHKATFLNLVPPIVLFLANHDNVKRFHVEHVRTIMSGAAPLGALDVERFKIKAPQVEFLQGYGMTETSPVSFISPNSCNNYASIGYPVSSTESKIVRVDDPNYIGCDVDEVGELLVRGPQVMKGYWNNDEATAETKTKEGWLRTGDLASYDADGLFFIKDRLKELIKVKGFQVPPAELEELLRNHPNVSDAAVIGIPHAKFGEAPRAFVVKKAGTNVTETELQNYVAQKCTEYKHLVGGVEFIEAVPKNATGKILRKQLKQLYL